MAGRRCFSAGNGVPLIKDNNKQIERKFVQPHLS
jgi:hypothetical protein